MKPHAIIILFLPLAFCAAIIGQWSVDAQTKPAILPKPAITQPVRDDAPALTALLAAGKTPPKGSVFIEASTVHLNGIAVNLSGVTLRAAPTSPVNMVLLALNNCSGSIIGNIFDGQRQARGNDPQCNGDLIVLGGCHDLAITGNTLGNSPADCIRVAANNPQDATTACLRVRIEGNRLNSCWRNHISVIGGDYITIQGNHFSGAINGQAPNAAVDVEANGEMVDAAGQVIYPGDAPNINHDIDIVANQVSNCAIGLAAMRQIVQTKVRYVGNTINGCTVSGIDNEADQAEICSNALNACGIGCDNCDGGTISSNVVNGAGQGIYCDCNRILNPTGHSVTGNRIDPTGVIDLHYCYGKVQQSGNIGTVKQ